MSHFNTGLTLFLYGVLVNLQIAFRVPYLCDVYWMLDTALYSSCYGHFDHKLYTGLLCWLAPVLGNLNSIRAIGLFFAGLFPVSVYLFSLPRRRFGFLVACLLSLYPHFYWWSMQSMTEPPSISFFFLSLAAYRHRKYVLSYFLALLASLTRMINYSLLASMLAFDWRGLLAMSAVWAWRGESMTSKLLSLMRVQMVESYRFLEIYPVDFPFLPFPWAVLAFSVAGILLSWGELRLINVFVVVFLVCNLIYPVWFGHVYHRYFLTALMPLHWYAAYAIMRVWPRWRIPLLLLFLFFVVNFVLMDLEISRIQLYRDF